MGMLEHWAEVDRTHTTIMDFLSWAEERGLIEISTPPMPVDMVDQYLEVDRKKLDKERRALLDKMEKPQCRGNKPN